MIKHFSTILLILFFQFGLIAQNNPGDAPSSENDIFVDKNSQYAKSLDKIIKDLEKTIELRLKDLEAKHDQLVVLRPDLKNKQTIVTEDLPHTWIDGYESNLLKYISFVFESSKVKEVTLGSIKKRIHYEFAFENKKMIFYPPTTANTKIILERFDSVENTLMKEISYDNQIKALRILESALRISLYKMDVMIVLIKVNKDRKNLYQIDI